MNLLTLFSRPVNSIYNISRLMDPNISCSSPTKSLRHVKVYFVYPLCVCVCVCVFACVCNKQSGQLM